MIIYQKRITLVTLLTVQRFGNGHFSECLTFVSESFYEQEVKIKDRERKI